MSRFILSLILAFMTVCVPVYGLCSYENSAAESCCCAGSLDVNCLQLSGACCAVENSIPAAPAADMLADLSGAPAATLTVFSAGLFSAPLGGASTLAGNSKPVHLATNKLYLLKRSLLI